MIKVRCINSGEELEFIEGTSLLEALESFTFDRPYPVLAAKVNFVVEGLKYRLFESKEIEFLDYRTYSGRGVYSRSLCFLLAKACEDVCPGCKVRMRRPVSKGYFCEILPDGEYPVTEGLVARISERMKEIVATGEEFHRHEVRTDDAVRMFEELGYDDKVKILKTSDHLYTRYYTLMGTPDIYYDVLLPSVSFLKVWRLEAYQGGMLLRIPDRHHPEELAPFKNQPKTFEVIKESDRWNNIMGLKSVGDVNMACRNGHATELIQVAEALQEKKIVQIAEEIERRYRESGVRLVLITGPSSSGKTTTTKRLSIQLKACGLQPVAFSTDDYFVDRVKTPRLPDGSFDFDNFDTVDHDMLQRDLLDILDGKEVDIPEYNFVTGLREYNGKRLSLKPGVVILLEGIHALNPALTNCVPDNKKYRIFINTITSIPLDGHNSIPTSDNRLLRRIVRDFNNGSFSAVQSISQWPNVRRSEVKWIYPYQEEADVLFNSAYLIEFAVLRSHAERVLATVPKNCREFGEAKRLLRTLQYFNPVSDKDVPANSLIRGFIGGGSL